MSHPFAKDLLAGFAGAEIDRIADKHGESWFDREKAKREVKRNVASMYDEHYIRNQGADQYDPYRYGPPNALAGM
jgi:xenotropic and polytropic retrovirus receptor 1